MEEQKKTDLKKEILKNLDFLLKQNIINNFDLKTCKSLLDLVEKKNRRFFLEEEKPKIPYELSAFSYFIDEAENGYPL